MHGVNADVQATLDRDNRAIGLLNPDAVIANNSVNSAIGAGPIFWQSAKLEDCPFLKLQPISRRECVCVRSILGAAEEPVGILDLRSERFHQTAFDDMYRKIRNIDTNPISF